MYWFVRIISSFILIRLVMPAALIIRIVIWFLIRVWLSVRIISAFIIRIRRLILRVLIFILRLGLIVRIWSFIAVMFLVFIPVLILLFIKTGQAILSNHIFKIRLFYLR